MPIPQPEAGAAVVRVSGHGQNIFVNCLQLHAAPSHTLAAFQLPHSSIFCCHYFVDRLPVETEVLKPFFLWFWLLAGHCFGLLLLSFADELHKLRLRVILNENV